MNGLLHLALNASFLVQLVMLTLIGLSIWSWVIIFVKKNGGQKAPRESHEICIFRTILSSSTGTTFGMVSVKIPLS